MDIFNQNSKKIIGWREWIALPELGIKAIKAKVDTGARTSSLHAFKIEPFTQDGELYVRFWLHPLQKNQNVEVCCTAYVIDQRMVSDSGGHREMRYVIETTALMNGFSWPIEITLTNRDSMIFRMLLGRTALKRNFIIDSSTSYCMGRLRKKKHRSN